MTLQVTQCPACESTFNTSPSLLETAAGRVRCGACLTVFDARENFIQSEPDQADSDNESVFVSQSPEQFFDPSRFLTRQSLRDALAQQSEAEINSDAFSLTDDQIQPDPSSATTSLTPEQATVSAGDARQSAADNGEANEAYPAEHDRGDNEESSKQTVESASQAAESDEPDDQQSLVSDGPAAQGATETDDIATEESDFMALVAAGVDESDEALIEPGSHDPIAAGRKSAPTEPAQSGAEWNGDKPNAAELAGLTDPAESSESGALGEHDEPGVPDKGVQDEGVPDEKDAQDLEYQDESAESPEPESPLLTSAAPEPGADLSTKAETRDDRTVSEALESAPESGQETGQDSEQEPEPLPAVESQAQEADTDAALEDSGNDPPAVPVPPASTTAPYADTHADTFASSFADSFADEQRPEHIRLHAHFTIETPLFAAPEPLLPAVGTTEEASGLAGNDEVSTAPGMADPADSAESGNGASTNTAALEEEDFQQALLESDWQQEQPDVELPEADPAEAASTDQDGGNTESWQQTQELEPDSEDKDLPNEAAWARQSETANRDGEGWENLASNQSVSDDTEVWQSDGPGAAIGIGAGLQTQTETEPTETDQGDQSGTGICAAEASDSATSEAESDATGSPQTETATTDDNADSGPQQESPEQSLAAIRARALQAELEDDEALEAIPEENLKVLGEFSTPVEIVQGRRRQLGRRLGWTLLALLAALGLASQYLWQELPRYSQHASLRPVYEWACSLTGCELPVYSRIDAIQSSNLSVRSHPQRNDALAVNVEFRNNADFPQEFPVMVLSFNSASNSVIALREFAPQEYLDEALQNRRLLPPATPVQVALEIMDPGDDAVNYTLAFRRP